jgi:glycosyltransferase involved in cell wall biosynthesis
LVKDSFEVFQKARYGFRVELLKLLRAWWTRRANRIIVPSRYLSSWVQGWRVPREKVSVIYNAVEPLKGIEPAPLPFDQLRPTTSLKITVVTVGRLVPWKDVDKVIEVLARLDGVGLIIIGDGPEREQLEALSRCLAIGDRIYFAGMRTKPETSALMAACDIFVLNSTYEGFSHVVLEAMGLGLPVVATAVGGTPEVVASGVNGWLIPPADREALQDALCKLISCPEDRQHLANGARATVERFSPARLEEETLSLLEATVQRATFR